MTPKEAYLRAGRIHYEVIEKSKELIKPGASLLAIAQAIEKDIASHPEASLAFPVNLQLNNEVHYSPLPGDTRNSSREPSPPSLSNIAGKHGHPRWPPRA